MTETQNSGFQREPEPDRSPQGLQYQGYSLDRSAVGVNGIGLRTTPDYSKALFSRGPLSGGQFNNTGNAKSTTVGSFSNPEEGE